MILKHPISLRSLYLKTLNTVTRKYVNVQGVSNVLNDKKAAKVTNILTSCGFNHGQISYLLKSPHSITSFSKEDIISNILAWQMLQVNNNKLLSTLTRCSELLTLNPAYVDNRVKELKTLFTQKDICKLLVTCPEIFLDDFEEIKEKTEYIVHFMGVEQDSIVKTGAMQFDLEHIKCRHEFMLRCGLYRVKKQIVQAKTAPLNKIFSRNIETFLKLSGLTKEEYTAFENAYEFEQEEKLLEGEDSDEDI